MGLSGQQLLKEVERQVLRSSLNDATIHHDQLIPDEEQDGDALQVNGASEHILFSGRQGGVLVQIEEIVEIGHPAHDLLKRHEARVEDKKVLKTEGRAIQRVNMQPDPTQTQTNGTQAATGAAVGDIVDNTPANRFPRHMLKLVVSDGWSQRSAIEYRRIQGLSLEDTQLGCKLLLKNVKSRRGILLLDDTNCIVKGGFIAERDETRDESLGATLRKRLQLVVSSSKRLYTAYHLHSGDAAENDEQDMQADVEPDLYDQEIAQPQPQHRPLAQRNMPPPAASAPTGPSSKASVKSRSSMQTSASSRATAFRGTSRQTARPETRKNGIVKKEEEADLDALLDDADLDDIDIDELASADRKPGTSGAFSKTRFPATNRIDEEDEDLWAALEEAEAAPSAKQRKASSSAQQVQSRMQQSSARPTVSQKFVDIDDSSDAELSAQLVPPQTITTQKRQMAPQRPTRVIEID
ncbi:hypothetical protein EMMF5_004102 [Cystobasidiomycetes sp. EMM_F5]